MHRLMKQDVENEPCQPDVSHPPPFKNTHQKESVLQCQNAVAMDNDVTQFDDDEITYEARCTTTLSSNQCSSAGDRDPQYSPASFPLLLPAFWEYQTIRSVSDTPTLIPAQSQQEPMNPRISCDPESASFPAHAMTSWPGQSEPCTSQPPGTLYPPCLSESLTYFDEIHSRPNLPCFSSSDSSREPEEFHQNVLSGTSVQDSFRHGWPAVHPSEREALGGVYGQQTGVMGPEPMLLFNPYLQVPWNNYLTYNDH